MQNKSEPLAVEGINENHRRFLSSVLGLLAKDLCLMELYLQQPIHDRMFNVVNDLSGEESEKLLSVIASLKKCIEEFANRFELEPSEENVRNTLSSSFNMYWVDLCEMEPRSLDGYGPIGADAIDSLDRYITRLKSLVEFRL
jgi:hypothetical protein